MGAPGATAYGAKADVLRLKLWSLGARRGLLMAACVALAGTARAQTAMVNPDPFAPQAETNPFNPPRFEKKPLAPRAQSDQPTTFVPTPSGAGATGFDATNARKKTRSKKKTDSAAQPLVAPSAVPASAGTQQASPPVSPYQVPPPPLPGDENAAFAQAAPGAPPVEPVEPIAKPKKHKKSVEDDPYAPLGIRAGTFDFFPAVEASAGYNTNPGQLQNAKGAAVYSVAPELKAQSDWSRHELKADLRGSYNWYSPDQTPSLNRPYFDGKVTGRVDVTHATRIDLDSHLLVSTDNPNSPNLQAGLAKLPIYTDFGGAIGLGQKFNRFDLSVKGEAERIVYQNSLLTDGTTVSNGDRNYDQYGGRLRGGYEMLPGMMPFVEFETDKRVHDLNTDFFGFQRDSTGVTGKAGTTFEMSKLLTGEIALGYTRRVYQDPRLQDVAGLIGDASLVWTATALTTVKLTGSSTVGEVTVPGASGALYRDVGLQVDHAFRRWLVGTVKVGFGFDDYVGLSREDKRFSVAGGLTYKFDRSWQVKGEVRQDWLRSNLSGNDYNATTMLLTLRWQK